MGSWDSSKNPVNIASKWSGVATYLSHYKAAYEILSDETTVTRVLRKLAESATTLETIKAELVRIERQHGFSEPVPILPTLLDPLLFFGILRCKLAFLDLGTTGDTHGGLTHRYQWAILADALVLPASVGLGDLYAGLSSPQTYRIVPHPKGGIDVPSSLWGDVFDAPFDEGKPKGSVYTARSPEFLMYYMKNNSNDKIKALYLHSRTEGNSALPPDAFDKIKKVLDGDRR
jgi:hypothetical protein